MTNRGPRSDNRQGSLDVDGAVAFGSAAAESGDPQRFLLDIELFEQLLVIPHHLVHAALGLKASRMKVLDAIAHE